MLPMRFVAIAASLTFSLSHFFAAPASAAAVPGSLVKLTCPTNAGVNDPCRAVYYYGGDGRRHAFPNERVYFSWYSDFGGVKTVTAAEMAALPLGANVTSRPGVRMVKFLTDPKTYAVAVGGTLRWVMNESAATTLYGSQWNTMIDDVSDAFFTNYRFGADIPTASAFDRAGETAAAATINDDLPISRRSLTVATANGNFSVELVKLQKALYRMATDTGNAGDCGDQCVAKPLADYATTAGAEAAIHGSYFCPPDYADCAGKVNTFLSPFFDTDARVMVNQGSLVVHEGPILAYSSDGAYRYFHRTKDFGSSTSAFEAAHSTTLEGAASNYPSLIEGGNVIVQNEARLDDGMKNNKSVRGAIGVDSRFAYMAIVRSATVPDAAAVMRALGATDALNLDGGGSAALWFNGSYAFGPGRLLPNAILFKKK